MEARMNTASSQEPSSSSMPPILQLDPDVTPIPGQQAWVILDLQGHVVRASNGHDNSNSSNIPPIHQDSPILFQMLIETAGLMTTNDGGLKRMTISFGDDYNRHGQDSATSSTGNINNIRYVIARDNTHIYMIQTSQL